MCIKRENSAIEGMISLIYMLTADQKLIYSLTSSFKIKRFVLRMNLAGWRILILCFMPFSGISQEADNPIIISGQLESEIQLDGIFNEPEWKNAQLIDQFKTIEPIEGGEPSGKTEFRVLAGQKEIVIGIRCYDSEPSKIVSFSKLRDTELDNEDHVRIVIDPFLDGQSGYIFAVNANGARYDALVSNRGESENRNWDAIWEAQPRIDSSGWTLEIRIPIQSINFKKDLTQWRFNIERRIQRNQETIRWANQRRDQWFIQTSRAGLLTNLPNFSYGIGLNIRPSIITDMVRPGDENESDLSVDPSIDISQRLSPNVTATLTLNTDFAEAEVDSRRTNLTRFPLFFPEKRAFFLEGVDIFEFGFGMGNDIIPFFSRRIGLYKGNEVPLIAGGKINGRAGKTSFGGMLLHTDEIKGDDPLNNSTMGVVRVKQNILKESSVGFISTIGDPQSRGDSWTSGVDFTYQTTRFQGNKNFLVGVTAMYSNRVDLEGDQSAFAFKVDYPNDLWDIGFTFLRIGEAFDPSLGFVPRKGIMQYRLGGTHGPRPSWSWLRQMRNQVFATFFTDLDGTWETYRVFTAPINWRFESGDRLEINYLPRGEQLLESFEISDGVIIPADIYHFARYRLEYELAAKRKFNGQFTWWFGSFYDGTLHELEAEVNWNPTKLVTFEFTFERNIADLPFGAFDQTLVGTRARINFSPNLQLNSFIQFDTDTDALGINTRLHWIFHPQGDLFLVYNYNTINQMDRWELESEQILLKARYNFRM